MTPPYPPRRKRGQGEISLLLINFHNDNRFCSYFYLRYFAPYILVSSIIWKWDHADKSQYLITVGDYPLLSDIIVRLFVFMSNTIHLYHYFVFQTREIHYEISERFLSTENVCRSLEHHPHTY